MSEIDLYDKEAIFYDALFDNIDDITLYEEYAKKTKGDVLECGCGTGRITIPLARRGINIVGIDINEKMLQVAKKKLAKEPIDIRSRVKLIKGDMRNFELEKKFSLCIIPFNTFLHMLTREDQENCLTSIKKHLLTNGHLIISVFNPDLTRPQNVVKLDKMKKWKNELMMRFYTQSFDFINQITFVHYIYDFVKSDNSIRRLVASFKLRYIFYDEFCNLIKQMGFTIESVYGNEQKSPFETNSPLIIMVAKN